METSRSIATFRALTAAARVRGVQIGFVPTMGALHEGHLSLVRAAKAQCGFATVSIFVNPTQFGPNEDFARYPRDEEGDLRLCAAAGADAVFLPAVEEMYPPGATTRIHVATLGEHLCGPRRPGHFDGVATVVCKLLNIAQADRAYFGEKDAQQLAIVRRMARDLDVPTEIVGCATVREPDGLALSSRNRYLSSEQRRQATCVYASLQHARQAIVAGTLDPIAIERTMSERLNAAGPCRIDYASVVDAETLQPVDRIDRPVLLAIAVWIGTTRLIDNLTVDPSKPHR
ncbi:MAG: pantoate--beta-alanine ligase [Planctomycetes bacterium]|nr:pantoate--beta-alanine ligase [Planctomycetota bacterium]